MKVVLFGATGMVGQGVLRECLLDDGVTEVVAIGRTATGRTAPKLREISHSDFTDFAPVTAQLSEVDACLFCLGVSSIGMSEEQYRRITYNVTLAAARALYAGRPDLRFAYVSGQGTNAQGRAMWARVKGQTENDLLALNPNTYMFRPGFIQPLHGVRSKTRLYSAVYAVTGPLGPVLRRLAPSAFTTTERMGRAMVVVARDGADKRILTTQDINQLGVR